MGKHLLLGRRGRRNEKELCFGPSMQPFIIPNAGPWGVGPAFVQFRIEKISDFWSCWESSEAAIEPPASSIRYSTGRSRWVISSEKKMKKCPPPLPPKFWHFYQYWNGFILAIYGLLGPSGGFGEPGGFWVGVGDVHFS